MLRLIAKDNAVLLPVKVVPGASRTRLVGEWDGRAKIAVAAAAEKGKANDALVGFIAKVLGVRRAAIVVVQGRSTPVKTLRIEGVSAERVVSALQPDRS